MIQLDWHTRHSERSGVALLFGTGLIGGTVIQAFQRAETGIRLRHLPWTWTTPRPDETQAIVTAVQDTLKDRPQATLSVIWAAGRSGFGTTPEGMAEEQATFERVLDLAKLVGETVARPNRSFVHISSAGGLFEGQVACTRDTPPAPLRPYGHGKLAQEARVLEDDTLGQRLVLRPSSVYGYAAGARRNLISALLVAGLQQRPATIFGSLMTLRDYVFAPDIGRFVTDRVLAHRPDTTDLSASTHLLGSGRPASVFEIIQRVEDHFGRALHLQIDPSPENARDNAFLPSAFPTDFRPTSLQEGLARTAAAVAQARFEGERL